jgi:hypothetical protein
MLVHKLRDQSAAAQGAPPVLTLTIFTDEGGNYLGYKYSNSWIELARCPGHDVDLTVNLQVCPSAFESQFSFYTYTSSLVQPVTVNPAPNPKFPSPGGNGVFQSPCSEVTFAFNFPDVKADQTNLTMWVANSKTSDLISCDPQVGNDAVPNC